jgi:hypothetical protein
MSEASARRPVIGVTLDSEPPGGYAKQPWYALRENYCDAIARAGGLPVALPHEPGLADRYLEIAKNDCRRPRDFQETAFEQPAALSRTSLERVEAPEIDDPIEPVWVDDRIAHRNQYAHCREAGEERLEVGAVGRVFHVRTGSRGIR